MASNETTKETPKVRYRIDDADAAPILLMAGLFDIISVIPLANDVNVFIAQPVLAIAFLAKGVNPLGPKNWVWFLIGWLIELIPGFSIFPTIVIESFRWIAISRVEDRLKAKGIDADSEKAKLLARRFLAQKKLQEKVAESSKAAVAKAARREDGSFDRDKIREKRGQIAERRNELDEALAPGSNSSKRLIDGAIRPPNKQPANDNERSMEGVKPAASEAA